MSLFDKLLGRVDPKLEAERKRKEQEVERAIQPLRKKAAQRVLTKYNTGLISKDQYKKDFANALGTSDKSSTNYVNPFLKDFKSQNGITGAVRNIFDSNSEVDKINRVREGRPELYRDAQIALGNKRPYESFGAQVAGNTARFLNTAGYGINAGIETARGGVADITNNDKALAQSLVRQKYLRDVYGQANSGLLGAGTIYDNPDEMTNLGNAEIAKRIGLTTLGTASETIPFARIARPVSVAGKATGNTLRAGGRTIPLTTRTGNIVNKASLAERGASGVVPRIATNAAIDVPTSAGESVARQYVQTGNIDPMTVLQDTIAGTALGQTQVAGGEALKAIRNNPTAQKAGRVTVDAGKKTAKTVNNTAKALDKDKLAKTATSNRQTAEARQAATYGKIELARQNGRPVTTLQKQFERDSRAVAKAKAIEKVALFNRDVQLGSSIKPVKDAPQVGKTDLPDKYAQEYADMLMDQESGAKGGMFQIDQTDATGNGKIRTTEHGKFYRDYYKANKRKPSKAAWLEHAREEAVKDNDFMDYVRSSVEQDAQIASLDAQGSQFNANGEIQDTIDVPKPIGQTKPQQTLKQPKAQTTPTQQSQIPQKTSLSTGIPEKVQKTPKKNQIEISSDGRIANIDQYIKEQVNAQEVKTGKSVKEKIKTLKRQWIDTLSPAEDNFRQLVKDGKLSQETLDDIIVKNGKSLRAGTAANLNLVESGLVDLIHKKSTVDYDNLGQTLIAIHSKDLRANGIETGRSPKLDEQIIAKYGKQFEADIEQFRKSADYVLNQSVDAQLISKETADMLKKKYPNYVPMNRVIEEIEAKGSFNSGQVASIGKQTVVRKIKGSKRVVENPMESMISKVQDMSKQKLRNEAALSWVDALKDAGDAKLIKGTVKPGQSTISVLRKGVKEIYAVDPEMEAAAKGLTKEQMNFAVEAARKVSRVFKTGTTGLNLPFIVTNLARDQQTSLLNMQKGELEFFKAAPSTVFETLKHGDLYKEAVRQGAISTSFDLTKPNLKQTAKGIRKKGASLGVFSKIEDVIGRSEEYTRLQQYKATKEYWIKKGFSEDKAITKATIAAQQNSADFARAGDFGRVINAIMPYTNAGVQGTRAYLRSAITNPKRYAIKASATIVTPMVMISLWNYGDDEREKIINDISDFEKQSNFIIVTPWAKKNEEGKWEGLVKIPKPPGISALTYPIEQTIAYAHGNDPVALNDITKAILGFGSPLGDNLNSAASTVTPQAIKPLAEVAINRNIFTGRDIVPFYMKDKPTNEQAYSYTSGTARGVGNVANTSPLNIEHLIRGYGGEVGLQGLNAIDFTLNKAGLIPEEQIGGRSIPAGFSRRFTEAYDNPDSTLDNGSTANKTIQAKGDVVSITDKTEKDSSGKYKTRDKYDAIINAYEGGKFEKNVQKYDDKELRKAISDVSTEAKKEFETYGLPTINGIKFDSRLARNYASYKKGLEGKDELSASKATQSFFKDTYKSTLDDISKSFYTLGDSDMLKELQNGTITKAQMDKIIEVDNVLTSSGLQQYAQVGKTLRNQLGYGQIAVSSSKTKSKGSKGKKPSLPNFKDIGLLDSTKRVNLTAKVPSVKQATIKKGQFKKKA
jgi:hypothetical protein